MPRYRQHPETLKLVPIEEWNYVRSLKRHNHIDSFEPYKPVTGDMQGQWIKSRREHKDFLRRNNLQEVGNEHAYMTRNGGMSADNPNLISKEKHEEQICQSLVKSLELLKSRR